MEGIIADFKPVTKPGEPSLNNYIYTRENLLEVINSEFTQAMINDRVLAVQAFNFPDDSWYSINPAGNIGYVVDWKEDNIRVKITDTHAKEWFIEHGINDLALGMRMISITDGLMNEKNAINIKIIKVLCFDIINTKTMTQDQSLVSHIFLGRRFPNVIVAR